MELLAQSLCSVRHQSSKLWLRWVHAFQTADLVGLVRQLGDDNSRLSLPTALPLSLAPARFACFHDSGSITTIALGVPFDDDFPPHGYASSPIMICCSDGICCKNLTSCKTDNCTFQA